MRSAAEAVAYAGRCTRSCAGSASATATCRRDRFAATPTSRCAAAASPLGTRCEIKNLNSFRFMEKAIEYEVRRQVELIEDGGAVVAGDAPLRSRPRRDAPDALEGGRAGLPLLPRSRPAAAGDRGRMGRAPARGHAGAARGAARGELRERHAMSPYDAGLLTENRAQGRILPRGRGGGRRAAGRARHPLDQRRDVGPAQRARARLRAGAGPAARVRAPAGADTRRDDLREGGQGRAARHGRRRGRRRRDRRAAGPAADFRRFRPRGGRRPGARRAARSSSRIFAPAGRRRSTPSWDR